VPDDYPVLSAGGVADRADVRSRLDAGAEAAVCGTRFLMTDESGGHPEYKARLVEADETVLTELFGAGWAAPHRVVPNEATARWLRRDPRGPGWLRALHRATAPILSRAPVSMQLRVSATQRASRPLFGPAAATSRGPASLVEASPLYAGTCVRAHWGHPPCGGSCPRTRALGWPPRRLSDHARRLVPRPARRTCPRYVFV
jgi:nitronate monooxygenase